MHNNSSESADGSIAVHSKFIKQLNIVELKKQGAAAVYGTIARDQKAKILQFSPKDMCRRLLQRIP